MQEASSNTVIYFYFDFNDPTKQYIDSMLRSLIAQILTRQESIPNEVDSIFRSCQGGKTQPQSSDLEALLKSLVNLNEMTYLVLDALDECADRQELLDFIEHAFRWKSSKLDVVMTSRKLKDFDDVFDNELGKRNQHSILNGEVDPDIYSFVHGKLQSDRRFKRWQKQPDIRDEIETIILAKADGM